MPLVTQETDVDQGRLCKVACRGQRPRIGRKAAAAQIIVPAQPITTLSKSCVLADMSRSGYVPIIEQQLASGLVRLLCDARCCRLFMVWLRTNAVY